MQRRHVLTTLLSLAALAVTALPARAQEAWPGKPVKLISPFPAGGTSDVMARIVAEGLSKELGQQVIVENIGGAGGTVGTLRASKSAADGYTLIQTGVGQNAVAHGLDPKLGYDSLKDFIHISQVNSGPNVLVVNAGTPFKTIGELIDFVRKNPGKLNYGFTEAQPRIPAPNSAIGNPHASDNHEGRAPNTNSTAVKNPNGTRIR